MIKYIRTLIAVSICAIFGVNAIAQNNPKQKIAVYVAGEDADESMKKVFGSKLVGAITKSNGYAAVERTAEFLRALRDESDYQTSGEVRDSQIASLGQKFGVRFVIVANITDAFDEYFISARLINVESGLVERSFDTNGQANSMAQLISLAETIANGIIIKPEQDEIARQKRIEEQKRLEEERKRQEQENERRRQYYELRQKAIANLMRNTGYDCFQVGNVLVMNHIEKVSYEYDAPRKRIISTNVPPKGWQFATMDIIQNAVKTGMIKSTGATIWVCCPSYALPYRRVKFNDSKNLGHWYVLGRDESFVLNTMMEPLIGETVKQNGTKIPKFIPDIVITPQTLFCRPMFSDAEIQAEINRIK